MFKEDMLHPLFTTSAQNGNHLHGQLFAVGYTKLHSDTAVAVLSNIKKII